MCEECRQSPCHPSCPNAEPPITFECARCGEEFYEGDEDSLIDQEQNMFCSSDCALKFHEISKPDWDSDSYEGGWL